MKNLLIFVLCFISLNFCCISSVAVDSISSNQSIADGQELVSSGGSFTLGFFSPGKSKNRYLGIWYKTILPLTVVWVANRENPLNDSFGQLTIRADGNIIILDRGGNIVWSTSSSRQVKDPIAKLFDSGNLVLTDGSRDSKSDSYVWQSFDHPSDTLLPGMKIGVDVKSGLNRYLISWKNADDPSPGNFSFGVDLINGGLPQWVLRNGLTIKFRTGIYGIWNDVAFKTSPWKSITAVRPFFTYNIDEVSYSYERSDNTTIMRFGLNQDGLAQRSIWDNQTLDWIIMYEARKDKCDNYGSCGPNAICIIDDLPILCKCLTGFTPKSLQEWDQFNWADGCIRKTQLNCSDEDKFQKHTKVKLPDLLRIWTNKSMNLKECEKECLENCTCSAYSISDINGGGHGCLLWFEDLTDIRQLIRAGEDIFLDLYVKLAASDIEPISGPGKRKKQVIMIVTISVISGMLLLGFVIYFIIKKEVKQEAGQVAGNIGSQKEDQDFSMFDFDTISTATDNFSAENKIGEGGFGAVYKGMLAEGQEVAVKRLSKTSKQGILEFKNEVTLIAKLQHRNLIRLLGGCAQGEESLLIYEYLSNKSLDHFIFDPSKGKLLPWRKRLDIITGIARGLLYLHQDSRLTIIHRDMKTSNILLDNEMNPKISDFGLARIFKGDQSRAKTKTVVGTHGYMSPEYAINGILSVKSDVFSFGVIVLEILSGLKNRAFKHPQHLLGHAWILWKEGRALELMDTSLDHSYVLSSELLRYMQVGLLCVQKAPEDRPTMSSVVLMLGTEGAILSQPKEPGFFTEKCSSGYTGENSCSNNTVTITSLEIDRVYSLWLHLKED